MQYLGSSDESPQSLTLLQNRVRVTQRPFSHLNSDILHDGPAFIANMEKCNIATLMLNFCQRSSIKKKIIVVQY